MSTPIIVGFELAAFWICYGALLLGLGLWRDDPLLIPDAAEAVALGVIIALVTLACCGFPVAVAHRGA